LKSPILRIYILNDIICRTPNLNLYFDNRNMSNSKRKHPIVPNCIAGSEKVEKQKANRKLRRLVKEKLSESNNELPELKEIADNSHYKNSVGSTISSKNNQNGN
jgi:hypothetical protein